MSRFVVVYVHVACTRAREATALLGHMLARQQVCGRGGACNGDIHKICTYRLLYTYVVDGVSLRHNLGGVGFGQLLPGVALVVFLLFSFLCLIESPLRRPMLSEPRLTRTPGSSEAVS